ncbi:MAG: hypothetical protein ACO1NQ_02060 [Flavobacteriales bacterium]
MNIKDHFADIALCMAVISLSLLSLASRANTGEDGTPAGRAGFIENKGQIHDQHRKANPAVRYLLNNAGMSVHLRTDGFGYDIHTIAEEDNVGLSPRDRPIESLDRPDTYDGAATYHFHRIDLRFVKGNLNAQMIPEGESEDYMNYYTDVTGEAGATFVRHYATVTYKDVWPNIDVRCKSLEDGFKYDLIVRPGGDLRDARFEVKGATIIESEKGELVFEWTGGDLRESIPASWVVNGRRRTFVDVHYDTGADGSFGFRTNGQGQGTLVIDPYPTNPWATYCGSTGYDSGNAVALDGADNGYLAGTTMSIGAIATIGTHDVTYNGDYDATLMKYSPAGIKLWGTYYGGSGRDVSEGVAVDVGGLPSICGATSSNMGIASAGGHQTVFAGGFSDAFLARFHANGTRMWGSYMGGAGTDNATGITIGSANQLAISGYSTSVSGIASAGAADVSFAGDLDAFVAHFTSGGTRTWSTYLGGSGYDVATGIAFTGNYPVVCGYTTSTAGIATGGSYDLTHNGLEDAFVARYTSAGMKALGTYFGGSGNDRAYGTTFNMLNRCVIAGSTGSTTGIASVGAAQATYGGGNTDGFIACFDLTNLNRVWSTYCGGSASGSEPLVSVTSTNGGSVAVVGAPFSGGLGTSDAWQPNNDNGSMLYRTFVAGYSSVGGKQWGGYAHLVFGYAIGGSSSSVLITGLGLNAYPPAVPPNAYQPAYGGGSNDAFLTKLDLTGGSALAPMPAATGTPSLKATVVDGMLTLFDPPSEKTLQITLCDASGRELFARAWEHGQLLQLPTTLVPGIYIAITRTTDGLVSSSLLHLP